jgi:hypothetical protein
LVMCRVTEVSLLPSAAIVIVGCCPGLADVVWEA